MHTIFSLSWMVPVAQLLKLSFSLSQHGFSLVEQNPSLVSRDSTRFYVSQTFLSLNSNIMSKREKINYPLSLGLLKCPTPTLIIIIAKLRWWGTGNCPNAMPLLLPLLACFSFCLHKKSKGKESKMVGLKFKGMFLCFSKWFFASFLSSFCLHLSSIWPLLSLNFSIIIHLQPISNDVLYYHNFKNWLITLDRLGSTIISCVTSWFDWGRTIWNLVNICLVEIADEVASIL